MQSPANTILQQTDFPERYRQQIHSWWIRMLIPGPFGNDLEVQRTNAPGGEDPRITEAEGPNAPRYRGTPPYVVDYLVSPDVLLQFAQTTRCLRAPSSRGRNRVAVVGAAATNLMRVLQRANVNKRFQYSTE